MSVRVYRLSSVLLLNYSGEIRKQVNVSTLVVAEPSLSLSPDLTVGPKEFVALLIEKDRSDIERTVARAASPPSTTSRAAHTAKGTEEGDRRERTRERELVRRVVPLIDHARPEDEGVQQNLCRE